MAPAPRPTPRALALAQESASLCARSWPSSGPALAKRSTDIVTRLWLRPVCGARRPGRRLRRSTGLAPPWSWPYRRGDSDRSGASGPCSTTRAQGSAGVVPDGVPCGPRRSGRARGDRIFVVQSVQDGMSENGSWSVEPMPMQLQMRRQLRLRNARPQRGVWSASIIMDPPLHEGLVQVSFAQRDDPKGGAGRVRHRGRSKRSNRGRGAGNDTYGRKVWSRAVAEASKPQWDKRSR